MNWLFSKDPWPSGMGETITKMNTPPKFTVERIEPQGHYEVYVGWGCTTPFGTSSFKERRRGSRKSLAMIPDTLWGNSGVTTAAILRAIDVIEAREAVLAVYPEASVGNCQGLFGVGVTQIHFGVQSMSPMGQGKTADEAWLEAAARLPKEKTPSEIAEGKVKRIHPDAWISERVDEFLVRCSCGDTTLGSGKTIAEAWLDAAAKLEFPEAVNQIATTTTAREVKLVKELDHMRKAWERATEGNRNLAKERDAFKELAESLQEKYRKLELRHVGRKVYYDHAIRGYEAKIKSLENQMDEALRQEAVPPAPTEAELKLHITDIQATLLAARNERLEKKLDALDTDRKQEVYLRLAAEKERDAFKELAESLNKKLENLVTGHNTASEQRDALQEELRQKDLHIARLNEAIATLALRSPA